MREGLRLVRIGRFSVRGQKVAPWLAAVVGLGAAAAPVRAEARDRDRDRTPDHEDHCPDLPGPDWTATPGCPEEEEAPTPAPPAAPAPDPRYPEPQPTPIDAGPVPPTEAGSCEGGVMQAEGGGLPPPPGAWWTFSFSCRVGAWLLFKGPMDAPLPPELVVRAVGRLTWDSTAHMLWFDVPDGAGGTRRVLPLQPVARSPAVPAVPQPPATPSSRTRAAGTNDWSCPGVFGGMSPASGLGATLTFTCDGEPATVHRFGADQYVPASVPAVGTRGTLRFISFQRDGAAWTEWTRLELAGGGVVAPETLLQQLMRESGEPGW
jgi:hypothetical protein